MLITNATIVTLGAANRLIENGALRTAGALIVEVGTAAELAPRAGEETLDAAGRLVMPGFLCGHTHFYGAFARGMAVPGAPATNFVEILDKLWWKLDRALLWDDIRYSALICLVDAVRHGCTTLIDHHASPNAIDGSLDIIADAVLQAGLRASLCYEVTDRNGPEGARAGIAENVRFLERCRREQNPQLAASFGLHAALTLSDGTLAASVEAASGLDTGFHIHVAEGSADQEESLRLYGVRVVERLNRFGVLGPRTIAVHCVHLDAYEKDILRETGAFVTHQPRSNMNNAVGLPDVPGLLARGIPVALGNDGFSNDMLAEMKTAYLAHKHNTGDPRTLPGDVVMQMAYPYNARLAGQFFPRSVGVIEPGAYADLVLLDYAPPTPLTTGNLPWHLIFGVDGTHVTHTIASGKVLMADRRLTMLDEEAMMAEARQHAAAVWKRIG